MIGDDLSVYGRRCGLVEAKSFIGRKKVCGSRCSDPPVLYDIVKRRFVRVPPSEFGHGWKRSISAFVKWLGVDEGGPSQGTLNPSQMIGLPNRCHRTDLEKLVFSAKTIGCARMTPKSCKTFWTRIMRH